MKTIIRLVSIGAGDHATLTHGPALRALVQENPDLELSAVCDVDPAKAAQYAAAFGYRRTYTDFRHMLDHERPDGVTLVVPAHLTAKFGSEILDRNLPLLLEKPPGRHPDELNLLREAAGRHCTPHLVAFNRRYMPLVSLARILWQKHLSDEKIFHLRCDFYRHRRFDPDFSTTAIHGLDLTDFLLDGGCAAAEITVQPSDDDGPPSGLFVQLRTTRNQVAQLAFCPLSGCAMERIHLMSANYAMTIELPTLGCCDRSGSLILYRHGRFWRRIVAPLHQWRDEEFYRGGFYHENRCFLDMLRRNEPTTRDSDLERATAIIALTAAVSSAIRTGQNQRWQA